MLYEYVFYIFWLDGGLIEGQAVQLEDGTTAYIQQVTEKGKVL